MRVLGCIKQREYTIGIGNKGANSCTLTKVAVVHQPSSGLSATTGSTAVSCFGGSNGIASVNVSGGTASYSYAWSPSGGTGATASGLTAGNYTCTITDANSCSLTKVVAVGQPSSGLSATTSSTAVSCFGGSNGLASVNVSGGTASYSYAWSPSGGTGATASGLGAGNYTCTITDANSCSLTKVVTVGQPTSGLIASTNAGTISCNGGITSVTVSATGGTPSYTAGIGTFTVSSGTYSYTVTDNNGCSATTSLSVNQPAAITSSQTHSVCAGGSFVVGVHTYTATGSYIDVLTSVHGCDSTVTTSLTVQNAIDISTSVNGGIITANQNGASYQWIDCNNANTPINGATNQSYSVTSGSYAVIVTLNSCVGTSTCVTIVSTGIHSISTSNDVLNIYPNPNNGAFTISSKTESTFMLVNELGQTIQTFRLNASTNFEASIQGLSSGIYYIVGSNNSTSVRKKIIVTQ